MTKPMSMTELRFSAVSGISERIFSLVSTECSFGKSRIACLLSSSVRNFPDFVTFLEVKS